MKFLKDLMILIIIIIVFAAIYFIVAAILDKATEPKGRGEWMRAVPTETIIRI